MSYQKQGGISEAYPGANRRETLEAQIRRRPLLERLEESRRRIANMCSEHRCPRMTVPPDPDDDDFFISVTAQDAIDRIKELEGTTRRKLATVWSCGVVPGCNHATETEAAAHIAELEGIIGNALL